jgi:hypothetical protein
MVERGSPQKNDASDVLRRLAFRARLTATSASALIVVLLLALLRSLTELDFWVLGFLALAALMGILYVGANPWMAATDFLRAAQVVAQIPGLTVVKARGFAFPRAVLRWSGEGPSGPDVTLRFVGGMAGEFGADHAQFRLELPSEAPCDVVASLSWIYADFPELLDLTEEVRGSLAPGEYMWSNVPKRRLESVVVPEWGKIRRPNEASASVVGRLQSRRLGMDAIRIRSLGKVSLAPRLVRHPGRSFPGPFALGAWCPRCRRESWLWNKQNSTCRRCRGPTVQVLSRWDERLGKKMERLEAAGFSTGA